MPKMALLPWLSAIAHIALALLLLQTRLELSTVRESAAAAAQAHRHLGEEEGAEHQPLTRSDLSDVVAPMQAQLRALQQRNDELTASVSALLQRSSDQRRRAQAGGGPADTALENVKIIKPIVVSCDTDPHACGGDGDKHRRAQSGEPSCDSDEVSWRTDDINRECCDEPSEDCSSGYPRTCNAGCAALFLPFWAECRTALGKESGNFEPVVELCEAAASAAPSLARQLNVACSDGTPAEECVPACCEDLHGSLMLLNVEGHDSKFACELRHGLYSWVGPAVRLPPAATATAAPRPPPAFPPASVLQPPGWLRA